MRVKKVDHIAVQNTTAGRDGPIAYLNPETTNGVYLQFVQKRIEES